ncbi:hypothetical protein [Brasilonema sp. UFV-L1]|nr:hypothetical protein [Brasilonema sp. UFV-L1]
MTKLRIDLLSGDRSGEHEVFISSARAIANYPNILFCPWYNT